MPLSELAGHLSLLLLAHSRVPILATNSLLASSSCRYVDAILRLCPVRVDLSLVRIDGLLRIETPYRTTRFPAPQASEFEHQRSDESDIRR
jgi:hypothetical protein